MNAINSNINISFLSGGEQLVISRLATKEKSGILLNEKERRFISDMENRGAGRKFSAGQNIEIKMFKSANPTFPTH